jgi:[acyl-carrier-protein] S-malonyltransferase
MSKEGWIFPGQGAQYPGMGRDFAQAYEEARAVFAEADAILDLPLSEWIFDADSARVHDTDVAQPGIFVTSVAICAVLRARFGREPRQDGFVAGLSLGEYTALWAAGALSFEEALRTVRARGVHMQAASAATPSGMSSVMGVPVEAVRAACEEASTAGIVSIANLNAPGQIVISGSKPGVAAASELLKERGARRLIPLKVAGAFHSEVMRPAAEELRRHLAAVELRAPQIPFIPNTTGVWMKDPEEIRHGLAEQVCSPVLWEQSMRTATAEGIQKMVEPGPGAVLKGLLRKIDPAVEVEGYPDVASLPGEDR